MNKKQLSERDICTKFITPALKQVGWNIQTQIREEVYFTDGRIYVRGSSTVRGKRKFADYILYYRPNIPIAVIEAKGNNHPVGASMQQVIDYAEIVLRHITLEYRDKLRHGSRHGRKRAYGQNMR